MTLSSCRPTSLREQAFRSTPHAVDALAIFYPRATADDVVSEVAGGEPIDGRIVAGLLERRGRRDAAGSYVLHRERTGIFVLVGNVVVTFLRFYGLGQHEQAVRLWPGGDPPTCRSRWISVPRAPAAGPAAGRQPSVADSACAATGVAREEIRRLVVQAVAQGFVVPGDLRIGAALVHVLRVGDRLRVVASRPRVPGRREDPRVPSWHAEQTAVQEPVVCESACAATGIAPAEIGRRVVEAVGQGFLVPGELRIGTALVLVERVDDGLRVVASR